MYNEYLQTFVEFIEDGSLFETEVEISRRPKIALKMEKDSGDTEKILCKMDLNGQSYRFSMGLSIDGTNLNAEVNMDGKYIEILMPYLKEIFGNIPKKEAMNYRACWQSRIL